MILGIYEIKCRTTGDTYTYTCKDAKQAWAKFCKQRFAALKPDPKEWEVYRVGIHVTR